jgi:hypothetical protein
MDHLEGLFGKKDEMHGHILENELISLNPRNYENLQDFFTKFKALLLQLKGCRIDKSMQGDQLILAILSKLGPRVLGLCFYFHTSKLTMGDKWKMPPLDAFIESLIHEQDKLIKMGVLKNSKAHALVVHESNKKNTKSKQKSKGKKEPDQKKGGNFKPTEESSNSKAGKSKKEKSKCSYCNEDIIQKSHA